MWQTPYDGSDSEVAVVAAVLRQERISDISREYNYPPKDVMAIMNDYLRHSRELLARTDYRQNSQHFRLASMDACLERIAPLALAAAENADVKIVQSYFNMIVLRHELEEKFWRANRDRGISELTPDALKAATTPQDEARSRHLRLLDYAERGLLADDELDFAEATDAITGTE